MKKLLGLLLLAATPLFANPFLVCPNVTGSVSTSPTTYTVSGLPNSPIVSNAVTITSGTVQLDLDLGAAGQNVPYGTYTVSATATNTNGTSAASANLTLNVPLVSVSAATSVGTTTATLNGGLTQDGGTAATTEGFQYGTTVSYGSDAHSTGSFTSGSFNKSLTGLTANTTYHYQSYASNANCSNYSSDQTFTTPAAIAIVQSNQTAGSSTAVSSATQAFGSAQTAGNLNVVEVSWYHSGTLPTISSITDTKGNTYTLAISDAGWGAGVNSTAIYYCNSIAAGSNTVTVNFSATTAQYVGLQVIEVSGTAGLDTSVYATGAYTTSPASSGNLTTTVSGDLLLGFFRAGGVTYSSIGTGYTAINTTYDVSQYNTAGAAGSYSATTNFTGSSGYWGEFLLAFKP